MKNLALALPLLCSCAPPDVTSEAAQALDPTMPLAFPAVHVPAGQPLAPRMHLGDLIAQWYDIDANAVHILAAEDCASTAADYWTIEVGSWQDGGWSPIVFASTAAGIGEHAGRPYETIHAPNALGWSSVLGARFTPHGAPCDVEWLIAVPDASIVP